MAEDGQLIGFHGRTAPADDNHWKAQCAQSPVDAVFYVQDAPFRRG